MNVWDEKWGSTPPTKLDFSTRRIFAEILKVVSFEGRTVLELGCGTGRLSFLALEAGAKSATLVDSSSKALELARDFFHDKAQVRYIQSDIRQLPPDLQSDIVLSSGLVEHFKGAELDEILKAHKNLAREKVIILVPASPHWNDIRMRLRKSQDEYGWQLPLSQRALRRALVRNELQPLQIRRFFVTYGMKNLPMRRKFEKALTPLESFLGGLLLAVASKKI